MRDDYQYTPGQKVKRDSHTYLQTVQGEIYTVKTYNSGYWGGVITLEEVSGAYSGDGFVLVDAYDAFVTPEGWEETDRNTDHNDRSTLIYLYPEVNSNKPIRRFRPIQPKPELPPLPTEPGMYVDADGEFWRLNALNRWFAWSNRNMALPDQPNPVGLRRMEPVT